MGALVWVKGELVGAGIKWLVSRLRGRPSLPSDSARAEEDVVVTLEQLHRAVDDVERGRAHAADDLASLLLAISRGGDAELIASTTQVLLAAKPRMWIALDVSARRSLWYAPQWTAGVARRLGTDHSGPLDLLLAACHPDGFVREAAVAAIAEQHDVVGALPMLAFRAADWVPEVRDRARQACQWYLDHVPAKAIALLAPIALALQGRYAGGWLVDVLERLLRDGPPEAMTAALAAEDWHTRRTAHTVALRTGRLSVGQMLRAATADGDLPIRIMCAEAAIRTARADGDRDIPRRLLTSGTAAVRAEAVHVMGVLGDLDPAVGALADRSALVRSCARARRPSHVARVRTRRRGTERYSPTSHPIRP